MTEDRKHDDDELNFDDDFVLDDKGTDDTEDTFLDVPAGSPEEPAPPVVESEARDAEETTSGGEEPEVWDDEEFVLEFEEDYDEEAPALYESPADAVDAIGEPVGAEGSLDSLFTGSKEAGELSGDESAEESGLFTAPILRDTENQFEGAREGPEFVEDYAGWYGDDVNLGEIVGELASEEDETDDQSLEFEEGLDDDPFQIDDVEVESLDEAVAQDDGLLETVAEGTAAAAEEFFAELSEGPVAEGDADATEDAQVPVEESVTEDDQTWAVRADDAPTTAEPEQVSVAPQSAFASIDQEMDAGYGDQGDFATGPLAEQAGEQDFSADAEELPMEEDGQELIDPIYGEVGAGIDAEPEEYDGEPVGIVDTEYEDLEDELEESYVDAAPGLTVVGGGQGRRFGWRKLAVAAVLMIAVGGGVAELRPEWLGIADATPVVHRVDVAQPRLDLRLRAPGYDPDATVPGGDPVVPVEETDPVTPKDPEPPVVDPIAVDPEPPVVDPVAVDPEPPVVDPVAVDPVPPDVTPVPVDPTPVPEVPTTRVIEFEPIAFGEGLEIRSPAEPAVDRREGIDEVWPGMRAFAQLHNEAIFVGVVKRVEANYVTLDLQPGEVSLSRSELTTLSRIDSLDASEFTEADYGFVRLETEARLWGRILRNPTSDNVILSTEAGRITIPVESVLSMGGAAKSGADLVDDSDDEWLERRARERLLKRGSTREQGRNAATPPAGR